VDDRADVLRPRIAYCRRRLAEGVDAGVAQEYLRQIIGDEGELGERANDREWRD
jgi:hypothetical protein